MRSLPSPMCLTALISREPWRASMPWGNANRYCSGKIVESEADYVLALKRNHRHLSEDVKDAFTGRYTQFIYSTLDKDHGRVEERIYTALRPQEALDESQYEPWKNLSSLVQVERLVTFSDRTERRDKQYYLSSRRYCRWRAPGPPWYHAQRSSPSSGWCR